MPTRNPKDQPLSVSGIPQRRDEPEVATCKKCENTWFEQLVVFQYPKHHSVVLGQEVPRQSQIGFYLMKCAKCGELHEPKVQIGPQDSARKKYDQFWDDMEAPIPEKVPGSLGEKI